MNDGNGKLRLKRLENPGSFKRVSIEVETDSGGCYPRDYTWNGKRWVPCSYAWLVDPELPEEGIEEGDVFDDGKVFRIRFY